MQGWQHTIKLATWAMETNESGAPVKKLARGKIGNTRKHATRDHQTDENAAPVEKIGPRQCWERTKKYATRDPQIDESGAFVQKSWPDARLATHETIG